MQAEGIKTVEPAGKVITSPSSQRMRWPPQEESKFPREVMAHHPNARLLKSLCLKQAVLGPKFTVAAAHAPFKKFSCRSPWCRRRAFIVCIEYS